ncbi:MAG: DUF202 domain-containing protein [Thermoleophilia bacterium]|nr:DUF202 domain-containing protein [Thermoleophilia bacterium]MDH3725604.1 DUF202 domain-containing protein [Thermoleophilia bacterium]
MSARSRPEGEFEAGLQHERTSLAWERVAVSMMIVGILLARFAAVDGHLAIAGVGLLQTVFGGGVLVWAGWNYEELHGPRGPHLGLARPGAAHLVGASTVAFTGTVLLLATLVVVSR